MDTRTKKEIDSALNACGRNESFSDMLLRLMDEQHLTGPELYKAANVSKSVFSKLTSDRGHTPRKHIALALVLSLELDLKEAKGFLEKAGYALSDYIRSDVIVSYCISEQINDVDEVNSILHAYDLPLLGSRQ